MVAVADARRPTGLPRRSLRPFTVEHFRIYCSRLRFDDGEYREPEPWQLDFARDVFRGYHLTGRQVGPVKGGMHDLECLLLVPEGNGKTTFVAQLALYGCDYADRPWIPVGASSRDQAKILYNQAKGFVDGTPGLERRFRCFDGYRAVRPLISVAHVEAGMYPASKLGKRRPGEGIVICPWDPGTNDGAIPYPYFICDELHRHGDDTGDLTLWRLWKGKNKKRGGQGIGISTAGEPGTEFEDLRDTIRQRAVTVTKRHGGTHYRGGRAVMYEFMAEEPDQIVSPHVNDKVDAKIVDKVARVAAKCNPLAQNTVESFKADLESPSLDIGDFKRLKCNVPARSSTAAITDQEWAATRALEHECIPEGERVDVGYDVAWKWDTSAIVPCWRAPATDKWKRGYLLLEEAIVEVPPRDGTSMHPDRIKARFIELAERNPIDAVVMDMGDAEDVAAWLVDELGVEVVDRQQSNDLHVIDYKNVMRGLRNCQPSRFPLSKAAENEAKHAWPLRRVKHSPKLSRHTMNAIARRLPRGDFRFDRPSESRNVKRQDRRVIDALTAAGMVVTHMVATEPDDMPMVATIGR